METEASSSTKFTLKSLSFLADPAAHRCELCFVHDDPVGEVWTSHLVLYPLEFAMSCLVSAPGMKILAAVARHWNLKFRSRSREK